MSLYSDNEIAFFKQLLLDFDIRIDGRDKTQIRKYDIEHNVINNCFSSLKMIYNNSKNEIIFTIKGELFKESLEEKNKEKENNENDLKIIVNIDSMAMTNRGPSAEEYKIIKNKMESLINNLMISKINTDSLIINKDEPKLYWKLYLDIFVFDDLRMSLFQLISIGIKTTLLNVKVPKMIIFKNEIDDKFDYDLRKNYEDLTIEDSEEKIDFQVPNIYVFSIVNNNLYLDPSDEELIITPNNLYISEENKKILNIESTGDSVEPILYTQIGNIIKNINS
jgi:exosome complex RNA-binding protein Rrp42 (RNase PH superfamily)